MGGQNKWLSCGKCWHVGHWHRNNGRCRVTLCECPKWERPPNHIPAQTTGAANPFDHGKRRPGARRFTDHPTTDGTR